MNHSISVTIIVPIYNAYEDTQQCLNSLLQYTEFKHEVLLMDDASPDERISKLTHQLESQYSHIRSIRNSQNVGFVKNCNIAFQQSEQSNDVVILNSDTIVTPNWLEKLTVAAYSSPNIATVTPLTNNGTVCSVPTWLESNEIPDGHTILSFANLIEKTSLHKYPRVPTAVGFCTYIKREVLNTVGYFDDINFSRGYGEENDFCCRASKLGYFHIIDDSTFIYHAGSKSFRSDKQKLIEENSKILANLHPRYFPEVQSFIKANPLEDILSNLQLHLNINKIAKLSPICFILHNSVDHPVNQPLGGTEYHCAALISHLSETQPVYNLFYNKNKGFLEFEIFYKKQKYSFRFPCKLQHPYTSNFFHHEAQFLRLLVAIFQYFQPSIVHIHHLIGFPIADVISALKEVEIPYIVSLHDYYLICPSYNLIDHKEKFCFEYKTDDHCKTCIQSLFDQGEELKQQWLVLCQQLLEGAASIIAPSQTALFYFQREYPHLNLSLKSKVIRHGICSRNALQEQTKKLNTQLASKNSYDPLKVALVGSINTAKGSKLFIHLLEKISQQSDLAKLFVFEVIGRFNLIVPPQVQNITIKYEYSREDLPNLLKDIHIAIFPNIWAETYCLTVDEVLAHGIPVITTPLSAASERVKEFGVGWVTNSVSANDFLETLLFVKNHKAEFLKVKDNIKKYPIVPYEDMVKNYLDEYLKIDLKRFNEDIKPIITPQEITEAYSFNFSKASSISVQDEVELQKLHLMIRAMESSKWWKLRVAWLRLKQKLGIPIDDWWMTERGGNFK